MRKEQDVRAIEKGGTGKFEMCEGKSKASRTEMGDLTGHFHELVRQVIIWGKISVATRLANTMRISHQVVAGVLSCA